MSRRGEEGRVEKISTETLVCSQDGTTSALYRHLQEQKNVSMERVSLCSNYRCQSGNISPGWGLCWWDTCSWSHGTALQRGGSAMSSLSSGRRRGPGHCCHSEQTGGTAWRHKLIIRPYPGWMGTGPSDAPKSALWSHTPKVQLAKLQVLTML